MEIVREESGINLNELKKKFQERCKKTLNIDAHFRRDVSKFYDAVKCDCMYRNRPCIQVRRHSQTLHWTLPVEEIKTAAEILRNQAASDDAETADAIYYCDDAASASPSNFGDMFIGDELAAETDDSDGEDGDLVEHGVSRPFNPARPFCLVALGVQGSGKSHSLAVYLEKMALLNNHQVSRQAAEQSTRYAGMCGLVCHYDRTKSNIPEVTSLCRYKDGMETPLRVVVYTSPTSFTQRVEYYRSMGYDESLVEVRPLLFEWSKLDVYKLNALMHIEEDPSQLYMHVIMSVLRRLQKMQEKLSFQDFKEEVQRKLGSRGQCAPLEQRFGVLEQYLWDNEENCSFFKHYDKRHSITDSVQPNTLIILDLTDPLLSSFEASSIFALVIDDFSDARPPTTAEGIYGKAIILDEAHKYLTNRGALAERVIDSVRLMRHEGLRILVSTQTPQDLPTELLELCTYTLLHRFHTPKWYKYLKDQLPLPNEEKGMRLVLRLKPGEAILFAGSDWKKIKVRERLTEDIGRTRI